MAIRKRKTKSGITWAYYFDLPGSSRESRNTITESGFATKKEAMEAEADRRISERELAEARARGVTSAIPKTLGELLGEFCSSYADRELAPKTVERYRQQIPYLSPELLAMPIGDLTSLHFTREWNRLRESGAHVRKSKALRPLSSKSVRNVASFVSSAFSEAIAWGFARINPVTKSLRGIGGAPRRGAGAIGRLPSFGEKLQSKDSTATAPARKSGQSATNRKTKDIENERIRPN